MGAAWTEALELIRRYGIRIAAMLAVLYAVVAGVLAALVTLFAGGLGANNGAASITQFLQYGSLVLGAAVPVILFVSFTAPLSAWRLALSQRRDGMIRAFVYGLAASVPAIFAVSVLAVGIIGLFVLVLLPFGFGMAGLGGTGLDTGADMVALFVFAFLGYLGFLLFLYARLGLAGPIMASRRSYNPFAALARSWAMTRRNSWRLMLYLFLVNLLLITASIVSGLVSAILPLGTGSVLAAQFFFNLLYGVILTFVTAGIFTVLSDTDIWAQAGIESVFD